MARSTEEASVTSVATLIFLSMLSSTLLIPAVRPLIAELHGGGRAVMNAFMSVNMLGALAGAPLLSLVADRSGQRRNLAVGLCLADAGLLWLCAQPLATASLLLARLLEGAANVGALSLLMGFALHRPSGAPGRSMGVAGTAVMAAVAAGAPLGTAVMVSGGPRATLQVGALVALSAAIGAALLLPRDVGPSGARKPLLSVLRAHAALRWPTLWVTAERFTVGCFVVTFSLHAHNVVGLTDGEIGVLYSWFLLPFAIAVYPMGRLSDLIHRKTLVAVSGLVYSATFLVLGAASPAALPGVLLLAGLSSAAVYACSLCYASTLVSSGLRSTSMGLLNAGGSFGMFAGTAAAGALSVALPATGASEAHTYIAIFWCAAAAQALPIGVWLLRDAGAKAWTTHRAGAAHGVPGDPPREARGCPIERRGSTPGGTDR